MKRWLHVFMLISCVAVFSACKTAEAPLKKISGANPGIIPAPAKCELYEGSFAVSSKTAIYVTSDPAPIAARFLSEGIKERTGLDIKPSNKGMFGLSRPAFVLRYSKEASSNPEGYKLTITPKQVTISAPDEAGLFYGVQSILQMADARRSDHGRQIVLPLAAIEDQPRFGYRGLMLDESRHFFGKKVVLQTLDMMAYLKMNRFHWHLTDSPGWRIEIKKYPKLTEIGSIGSHSNPVTTPDFYTQDDIREIVRYAADRQIMVIPEIDMPGHANAATRAYPELSGGVARRVGNFTFNPGKEETYKFLEDVLTEVSALFPAPYIHLGGDEVSFGSEPWDADPLIQKFAAEHGLKNKIEVEHYFVRRMSDFIQHKLQKKVMGWDEITSAGVPANNTVLYWWRQERPNNLRVGLDNGYPFVLCPRDPCYLDFIQAKEHKTGRKTLNNTIESVYNFPDRYIDKLVKPGQETQILGLQGCVWTEVISTPRRYQYMTYPRIAALAEDGWTPRQNKNLQDFMMRLRPFLKVLDRENIYYFDPFDPERTPEPPGPVMVKNPYGV